MSESIKVIPETEIAACNVCRSKNYKQNGKDGVDIYSVRFEMHPSTHVINLCPECLQKLSDAVSLFVQPKTSDEKLAEQAELKTYGQPHA